MPTARRPGREGARRSARLAQARRARHGDTSLFALVDPRVQPISLTHESASDLVDRLDDSWLVSEKADGERRWLAAAAGSASMRDRAGRERPLHAASGHALWDWAPLLLDGELVGGTLQVFDVAVARGRDVRGLRLHDREAVLKRAVACVGAVGELRLAAKPWLPAPRFRELEAVEGLIFQHATILKKCFKWKRPERSTIDLRAGAGGEFPTAARMGLEVELGGHRPREGGIYELGPGAEGRWVVLRERRDKTSENGARTLRDTVAAVREQLDIGLDFL